ncbi:carbohydrate binding domain-containing protein [Maribacter sp.]|nr:carbohydrate binding domain-containing protein [Maribacter sp.]
MKATKLLYLFSLSIFLWSCSDDDTTVLAPPAASFTVTVDPDNDSKFYFDNTTPNAEDYYSYWQFTKDGQRVVDDIGLEENTYSQGGDYEITLTVVGLGAVSKASNSVNVVVVEEPVVPDPEPENSDNLVANGSLELGDGDDFTNWSKFNGADRMTEETTEVYEGARSLKVVNPADGAQFETQLASDVFATEIGATYTASVWLKGEGSIRFSTNAGLGDEQYAGDYAVTSEWSQYTWTITASTTETTLVLDMGALTGTFYVDAIAMASGDMPLPPATPEGPASLVANGDFESGDGDDFTNWSKFNGADRMAQETTEVFSGARSLKITNPADGAQFETQLASDVFATEVGSTYTASVWLKGEGSIRFSTNAGLGDEQYAGDYTVTSDWSQYTWTITASTAETTLVLDMGALAGTYFVDLVQMVSGDTAPPGPTPTGPESLALNGGLELGDGDDFTNWSKFNGADRMTQEATEVYEGARSMKVTNPTDGAQFETQLASDAFATEVGTSYTASVWLKGEGSMRFSTNAGLGDEQYAGDYAITSDWTQYTWTITASTAETTLVLDMGALTGTFYADAIEFLPAE